MSISPEVLDEAVNEETTEAVIEPETATTEETIEQAPDNEPKTFDEAYVKTLRKESATYREKAKRVDEMGARLHSALVTATGRLQDATDLPYDEKYLDDPQALLEAIDGLLQAKPHLASRRPSGFIPQGATPEAGNGFSLAGMLRSNAGG